MDSEFEIKTLINELAPILILMELAAQGEPLSAAQIKRAITGGRFVRSQGQEQFKLHPSLLYNLMKDLVDRRLLSRDADENTYKLLPTGEKFLKGQLPRVVEFVNDLQEFVREAKESL